MDWRRTSRPLTSFLAFFALNVALLPTVGPVYDFVCFLPYWERRRERKRQEREAARVDNSKSQSDQSFSNQRI